MRTALLLAAILLGAVAATGVTHKAIEMRADPPIAFAPADIRARVRVEPDADNRLLAVSVDAEGSFAASSRTLDGDHAPITTDLWFKNMPSGEYEVTATLTTVHGTSRTARARVSLRGMQP